MKTMNCMASSFFPLSPTNVEKLNVWVNKGQTYQSINLGGSCLQLKYKKSKMVDVSVFS